MVKTAFKLLKRFFQVFFIVMILFTVAVIAFVNTVPQIGNEPEGKDLERISKSPNYGDGEFINLIETHAGSVSAVFKTLPEVFFGKNQEPTKPLPVRFGQDNIILKDSICAVTWFGHSAFLMEIEGKRILIDPMLGEVSAPISFGAKRFEYEKPIPLDELTDIDAIIISHDHYDHLDYPTVLMFKDKVKHFYTPLGVGSHLKHWGVPENKITELDWWQKAEMNGIELIACPSRHFSGRGLTDRNATQWASWVIKGKYQRLYFSGDGGYGEHFKEIGEKYGPFDLAMMECGQYNEAWSEIHMMPEESVLAGIEVKGKLLMPIHWGAFRLSVHEWTDPIDRFKAESMRKNVIMIHPMIGERFELGKDLPLTEWWKTVLSQQIAGK